MAYSLSQWSLIVIGLFLIYDGIIDHRIVYNYPPVLAWVNPLFTHAFIGVALLVIVHFDSQPKK